MERRNSTMGKCTRKKTVFGDDMAALKAVYLAIGNPEKKWTRSMKDGRIIINQLTIQFENQCTLC